MKGKSKVFAIFNIASNVSNSAILFDFIMIDIKKGVIIIPKMPEIVASNTAPATLPFPIAVMVTDDEIVEERAQRKKKPSLIESGNKSLKTKKIIKPIIGKIIKVID